MRRRADAIKKFIIAVCAVVVLFFAWNEAFYRFGIYVDLHPDQPVTTFMTTDSDTIYMERDGVATPFEIRGVNLGVGLPGEWATDYAIDYETYARFLNEHDWPHFVQHITRLLSDKS